MLKRPVPCVRSDMINTASTPNAPAAIPSRHWNISNVQMSLDAAKQIPRHGRVRYPTSSVFLLPAHGCLESPADPSADADADWP